MKSYRHFFILLLLSTFLAAFKLSALDVFFCDNRQGNLMNDLLIVNYWNQRLNERLPVTYNNFLQGGYINMPSARMGADGEIGAGAAYVHPYHLYSLRTQLMERLEVSLNYRVFRGVADPVLGKHGFGDFSDKGINVKFSLFSPEDSHYQLPGVAIGFDDVMGTRAFKAHYIVLTQVLLDYNMEISFGYGLHRIRGFFGGFTWMPFRKFSNSYLKGLSFTCEYDATPYRDEEIERHPEGRVKKSPINIGLKYRLWDVDFTLSYVRGHALAFSASSYYNFGTTKGILPKIEDPLPYKAPVNTQEIGYLRPEDVMVEDFMYAFREQGFELIEVWLSYECKQKVLRLHIINGTYRSEFDTRDRLNHLLASLTPSDIDRVIIVLEGMESPVQEYHYQSSILAAYREKRIGRYELNILTPIREVTDPDPYLAKLLFKKDKELWNLEIYPKTHFLFGSAKGKFKYAVGLSVSINGFLFDDLYYSLTFGYLPFSNLYDINDMDRLNPSQIINVRTDVINYYKQKSITVDEAYIQKVDNLGCGFHASYSIGLFEAAYGGVATELLYYPVNKPWAIGVEGAILKKRTPEGVGFTDKIRQLHHFTPTYKRFLGTQYFLSLYYDWTCLSMEGKISAGKFLANDYGARFEMTRYFPSGLRLTFWTTYTDGHDTINGQHYHDVGFYMSIPLDIFYTKSSRARWGYGMSAWLRDVGVKAFTGRTLYYLIDQQRE